MNPSNTHNLWMGTLVLASAGALMSACGPQDGGSTANTAPTAAATPQTVAPATTPAPAVQAPVAQAPADASTEVARPAPAKPAPVQVAKQAPAKPPAPKAMPVKHVEPAPEVKVAAVAPPSNTIGAVTQIDPITESAPTGVGAVAGGALGGVLGHQFGKGDGKKAMTVLGVVGGAVAGHQVEKSYTTKVIGYRVHVQLDNGETRTFEWAQLDGLKVGDRVRIDQGQLRRA